MNFRFSKLQRMAVFPLRDIGRGRVEKLQALVYQEKLKTIDFNEITVITM